MESKLKAIRTGHKGAVTRLWKNFQEIGDEEDVVEEIQLSDEYMFDLESKIRQIRKLVQPAKSISQISPVNTVQQLPNTNADRVEHIFTTSECNSLPANGHTHLNPHADSFEPSTSNVTPTYTSNPAGIDPPSNSYMYVPSLRSSTTATSQYHKLPKLNLPTFEGNILNWQSFWDSYETAIHTNPTLSDVQKFNYLRSLLQNEALQTIAGFSITNTNYGKAIALLQERYGQIHTIIHTYMQALLDMPPPIHSLTSLRTFYDKTETYVRGLESLGQTDDKYGSLLVPVILNKLPAEIRQNLAREHRSTNWTLFDLRRSILDELKIMEAGKHTQLSADMYQGTPLTASFLTNTNTRVNSSPTNKVENHTMKDTRNSNIKQKPCVFCPHLHDPARCPNVLDYDTRLSIVKQKKLCFNCLGSHRSTDCKSKFRCKNCKKKHHTSICNVHRQPKETSVNTIIDNDNLPTTTTSLHSSTVQTRTNVLLKTAVSPVWGKSESIESHILFDEGAQRSFVTEDLATKLNIEIINTEVVHLSAFGSTENKVRNLQKGRIYVESLTGKRIPIEVLVVPTIANPITNFIGKNIGDLKHLRGLRLAHPITTDTIFDVSILIGADYYWDFIEDEIVRGNGPTAVKSKLGYLLSGPLPGSTTKRENIGMYNVMVGHKNEEFDLEKFWKLESLGVEKNTNEESDENYLKSYQTSSIEFRETRYVAKLPWKPDHESLPSNFAVTKRRTENVIRKLSQTSEMLKLYGEIMADQERRGFIEKVEDNNNNTERIHYIPHHPVKKDSSTTPIRIVYDCSCRESQDSPSLNDCLMNTPPIVNDLTKILVRFRSKPIAFITDIEKAFLNVGLHEQDRDVTRFLWLSNPHDPNSELTTYRFKSVLFGATCSPFILTAVLLKHLQNARTETAKMIERDIYVDNILCSVQDEQEASTFYNEARQLMNKAGFNLRSWTSNNQLLRNQAAKENVFDTDTETKILGMRWNVKLDELSYARRVITNDDSCITKREILKESSKIFDPLGLLSPVSIRAKILIQELWKGKFDWDEPLPSNIQTEWTYLAKDLETASTITFPRHYFKETTNSYTLHIFVDASVKAYGAVAYIQNGDNIALVMAKTRVAPLKELTLPQLELMAAVIGARLTQHLRTVLEFGNCQLWSDSQIVLQWIRTSKPVKRFVSNRIKEIKELTTDCHWNYCPTNCNPADLLTRGLSAKQFIESLLWKRGPTWITHESIPTLTIEASNISADETEDSLPEKVDDEKTYGIGNIMNVEDYGSYNRLLRVTGYVRRFVYNSKIPRETRITGSLKPDEIEKALFSWIKYCQEKTFPNEINALRKHDVKNRLSRIRQLRLFLDKDDLLRCQGRIQNAPISDSAKYPYLMPTNNRFSELVVVNSHIKVAHSGVSSTIAHVRQTFWIPSLRQYTRKILHKCITCRKVTGQPYRAPDPPPLQKVRLQEASPFTVTGVDFTGALQVKENNGIITKAYICLFTCASTRAVHLEVIPNMTTETFILAFRRFSSRKSLPQIMISDNALTFISTAQELKQLCDSEIIKDTLSTFGVEWRFIPKRAPWFGGWWERLIALTKTNLKKILGCSLIDMDMLQTVVVEVEKILNDRPLTYVSTDINDSETLTPAHLLYGRKIASLPYPRTEIENLNGPCVINNTDISKRATRLSLILEHFWNRWKYEYLTSLREFHQKTGHNDIKIKIGDVVQVHDEKPRNLWKTAVVEELVIGNDGLVRSALIRTNSGRTSRPIIKLYPLEISEMSTKNTSDENENEHPKRTLPERGSAIRAKKKIQSWTR